MEKERLVVSLDFYKTPFDGDKRFITPYITFLYKEIDNVTEGVKVLDEAGTPTPEIDPHTKQLVEYDDQKEKEAFARHLQADAVYRSQQEDHRASMLAHNQATAINDLAAQQSLPGGEAPILIPVLPVLPPGVDPGPFVYARNTSAAQRVIAYEKAGEKMRKVATAALKKMEETLSYGLKTKHVKILSDTSIHPRKRLIAMHRELLKLMEGNLVLIASIKNDVRKLREATSFQDLSEIIGEIDKFDFQIASMSPEQKYRDSELIAIVTGEKTSDEKFNQFKLDWARRERQANREVPSRSLTWDEFKEEVNLSIENLPGVRSTTALSAVALATVADEETIRSLQEQLLAVQAQVLAANSLPNYDGDKGNYGQFARTLETAPQPRQQQPAPPRPNFRGSRLSQRPTAYRGSMQYQPYNHPSNNPRFNTTRPQPLHGLPLRNQSQGPQRYQQGPPRLQPYGGSRSSYGTGRANYGGARSNYGGARGNIAGARGQGRQGARAYAVMTEEAEDVWEEREQHVYDYEAKEEDDHVTYEEPEPSSSSPPREDHGEA